MEMSLEVSLHISLFNMWWSTPNTLGIIDKTSRQGAQGHSYHAALDLILDPLLTSLKDLEPGIVFIEMLEKL